MRQRCCSTVHESNQYILFHIVGLHYWTITFEYTASHETRETNGAFGWSFLSTPVQSGNAHYIQKVLSAHCTPAHSSPQCCQLWPRRGTKIWWNSSHVASAAFVSWHNVSHSNVTKLCLCAFFLRNRTRADVFALAASSCFGDRLHILLMWAFSVLDQKGAPL